MGKREAGARRSLARQRRAATPAAVRGRLAAWDQSKAARKARTARRRAERAAGTGAVTPELGERAQSIVAEYLAEHDGRGPAWGVLTCALGVKEAGTSRGVTVLALVRAGYPSSDRTPGSLRPAVPHPERNVPTGGSGPQGAPQGSPVAGEVSPDLHLGHQQAVRQADRQAHQRAGVTP